MRMNARMTAILGFTALSISFSMAPQTSNAAIFKGGLLGKIFGGCQPECCEEPEECPAPEPCCVTEPVCEEPAAPECPEVCCPEPVDCCCQPIVVETPCCEGVPVEVAPPVAPPVETPAVAPPAESAKASSITRPYMAYRVVYRVR